MFKVTIERRVKEKKRYWVVRSSAGDQVYDTVQSLCDRLIQLLPFLDASENYFGKGG